MTSQRTLPSCPLVAAQDAHSPAAWQAGHLQGSLPPAWRTQSTTTYSSRSSTGLLLSSAWQRNSFRQIRMGKSCGQDKAHHSDLWGCAHLRCIFPCLPAANAAIGEKKVKGNEFCFVLQCISPKWCPSTLNGNFVEMIMKVKVLEMLRSLIRAPHPIKSTPKHTSFSSK